MIRINLLASGPGVSQPRVWVPVEQRAALAGLGMLVVTGLLIVGWWYGVDRERAAAETGMARAEARIGALKDAMKVLDAARTQKAELEARLAVIDRLRAAKHAPVRMLNLFNAALPDGLWLLEIKQSGTSVQLEGRSLSQTAVSDFAKALQDSGQFRMPVEIVTTLLESVEDTSVFRFVLKAEPVAAEAAAPKAAAAMPPAPAGRPGL